MDTIGLLKSVRFCIALWLVVRRSLATIVRLKPSSTIDEIAACQRPADKKRRMERNRLCALPRPGTGFRGTALPGQRSACQPGVWVLALSR